MASKCRKERRREEMAARRAAKKAGVAFDPSPFKAQPSPPAGVGGFKLRHEAPKEEGWPADAPGEFESDGEMWVTVEGRRPDGSFDFLCMNFLHEEDFHSYAASKGTGEGGELDLSSISQAQFQQWRKQGGGEHDV